MQKKPSFKKKTTLTTSSIPLNLSQSLQLNTMINQINTTITKLFHLPLKLPNKKNQYLQ